MRFSLRQTKTTPPLPPVQPEAIASADLVPQSEPLPYTKLELHWAVVDGKLVCEWRQQPD